MCASDDVSSLLDIPFYYKIMNSCISDHGHRSAAKDDGRQCSACRDDGNHDQDDDEHERDDEAAGEGISGLSIFYFSRLLFLRLSFNLLFFTLLIFYFLDFSSRDTLNKTVGDTRQCPRAC